jgi:hypothetical protein
LLIHRLLGLTMKQSQFLLMVMMLKVHQVLQVLLLQ